MTGQKFAFLASNKWRALSISLLLLGIALAAEQDSPPVSFAGKIALPDVHGTIDHLAADYYNSRLFVAAAGDDRVLAIDVRTNSILGSLRGVVEPHSVAYVHSSNRIFVTDGEGSVAFFDSSTFKPIGLLPLGMDPEAIRVDAAHGRVYVGYGSGAIVVLDPNGKRIAEIALQSHPDSFQIAQNQPRLFANLPDMHSVAVVDTDSLKVIAEWPLPDVQENFPLALDEERHRVFVACRQPARLLILDSDSGHVIAHLPTVGDANDLFYDPIHSRVYVTGGRGQIAIYAQQTADQYDQLDSVATSVGARTGLFVPEWNQLFVALRDFSSHAAEIRIYNLH